MFTNLSYIFFLVLISVCMFFRCSMKKTCDITNVLSGNIFAFVHKTKYLGVLLCSDMKTFIDVCLQTTKFYAHANTLVRNFRYCADDVKCMLFCLFAPISIVPHYGLTLLHLS